MPGLPAGGAHWVDHVARHAHANPESVALRFSGSSITWATLHTRVLRAAALLAVHGVGRGDRVAILMTNRPEFVDTVLGANAIGAIAVPVNFRLAAAEVSYILSDCGAAIVVTDEVLAPLAAAACSSLPAAPEVVVAVDPQASDPGAAEPTADVDEHEVALIMYTSGTTGRPKGAMLTHLNLLMQAITTIRTSRLDSDDHISLLNVPLFHIAGVGRLPSSLMIGSRTVIMATAPFDAQLTLDVIESEGVTDLFLVPAQWQMLCAHPDATRRCRSLRSISWGAAPASVSLLSLMNATFPDAEIISVFGQTEMSPVTTSLPGRDAIRKIGSVGKPIPTISARIVDPDMTDVAAGEVGEILYRGPTLMAGYWNNPAATAEAFAGGWFHSGDLVRADSEGFLYVVDRVKDMIISGGENIYCAEVENALAGHPAVADVAIVGVPHERWGETPLAVVVPADPAAPPALEDLTGWIRDKLASYKKPTRIEMVASLPRNAAGKVLKHELRARYANPCGD
jgi:fatty-acyl-CoA synthase